MVITFASFQNFLSFKEKIHIDFTVNDQAPQNNHFSVCGTHRFSKISAVFGANASGKTNLIVGFRFLQKFIAYSFAYSGKGFASFFPFQTAEDHPSSFEVHFYIDNVFYKYCVEINAKRVLSEVLESRQNKRLITLYDRKCIPSDSSYTLKAKNINLENSFIEKVRPNASLISTARQYNHPELTKIRNHWTYLFLGYSTIDDWDLLKKVSEYYSKNSGYFQKTKEFLKKSDLGLIDVQIQTKEKEDIRGDMRNHFYPYGVHKSKDKTFTLPFPMESGGTINLYNKLSFIFPSLKKGSACFIDELENNLHPNILPAIIDLFIDPETNPKGVQLICTTHANTLMSELSKYQIFMVEKNAECESHVYRLDEIEGIRSDDNFSKKYLAGSYGGVPDIDM